MSSVSPNSRSSGQAYWDQPVETQSRAGWDTLKMHLLQNHLAHAYLNSPYYRASFDAAVIQSSQVKTLDDIRRFPFLTKHILRERQLAILPFLTDHSRFDVAPQIDLDANNLACLPLPSQ